METPELLPCPCGGKAHSTGEWVGCTVCSFQADSVDDWNRRAPDAASEKVRREVAEELLAFIEKDRRCYYSERGRGCADLEDVERWLSKLLEGLGAE